MKKVTDKIILVFSFGIFLLISCHKVENVQISKPQINQGQEISSDTLRGALKGTLKKNGEYYFDKDIVVNEGDTLFMQDGVRLIALGDGSSVEKSPQITINGTFISLGTQDNPNFITVKPELAKPENSFSGIWGGIQAGQNSGDIIIKWTHIEYVGGPAGPENDPAVYTSGDPRFAISYSNINGNFILEDSWISNTKDDGIRIISGKISIMRNTFENTGEAGGESLNVKSGTVGDIAFNLFFGAATNGAKISNSGGTTIQCDINLYNNTFVNCGFRQVKEGRGGSANFEKGAKGLSFNNMVINCRYGIKYVSSADMDNIKYGNQFYYANGSDLISNFYPPDGEVTKIESDIISESPGLNNPKFALYDVDAFNYGNARIPMGVQDMPNFLRLVESANLNLLPGSPAIGKGNTLFEPYNFTTADAGSYGSQISLPGSDIGAFQTDGSGNSH